MLRADMASSRFPFLPTVILPDRLPFIFYVDGHGWGFFIFRFSFAVPLVRCLASLALVSSMDSCLDACFFCYVQSQSSNRPRVKKKSMSQSICVSRLAISPWWSGKFEISRSVDRMVLTNQGDLL